MTFMNAERSVSIANGQNPAACLKPAGLLDGDTLIAVVTVPTPTGLNAVVTPPSGWTEIGTFHATATSGMGVSQAWFAKRVPVAAEEMVSNYAFTATDIGASRVLVQILRMSGLADVSGALFASQARSTSTVAISTGQVTTTGEGEWDLLYAGSTRAGNTFTASDRVVDAYNPAANTASGIFIAEDLSAGAATKAITTDTASSVGLGVIVALKHVTVVPPRSPYKTLHEGALVDVDLYIREDGALVKLS